jgi:DNA polymerase-3 subunit epsilon
MRLKLHKPLIVFDLETTGVIPSRDKIVELFMIKVNPDGSRKDLYQRFNPEILIPAEVTAIHGISNEDVANEPTFKEKAHDIFNFINQCDFAGFNSNKFDFPMLVEEFYRANIEFDITKCKFVDAQRIYHMMEPRTLSAAYQFYCEKPLDNAHSAKADTEATWEIIQAQIEKYQQIEPNVEYIHKLTGQGNLLDLAGRFILNDKSQAIFNFGKHKGKTVETVFKSDPGYYDWMMQGDFSLQTKKILTKLKLEGLKQS